MTNLNSDLNRIRKECYNEFYSVYTDMLDYLEADCFISTYFQTVIYKKHHLRKIDMRPARILPSIERYEYDVVMREFKGIACVSGKAEIKQNDGKIL
ncbi:nuclear transport factor 2 family protein, partial [Escherichia coli]|nr:nuclear transport factor 2 family protein [Escherichia coli]